jgi:hypothetical protein
MDFQPEQTPPENVLEQDSSNDSITDMIQQKKLLLQQEFERQLQTLYHQEMELLEKEQALKREAVDKREEEAELMRQEAAKREQEKEQSAPKLVIEESIQKEKTFTEAAPPTEEQKVRLVDMEVTDITTALSLMISFLNLAQRRGIYSLDESSKIWECIKRFQK